MLTACGWCWSAWADDFVACGQEHLDRRRGHRSAARLHRTERRGANVLDKEPYSGHVFVFAGRVGI